MALDTCAYCGAPAGTQPPCGKTDRSAIYLYDSRGTHELSLNIPLEMNAASSKKITVVVTEIHSHLSKDDADALIQKLLAAGIKVLYGERP
jgi:hypothetical protein